MGKSVYTLNTKNYIAFLLLKRYDCITVNSQNTFSKLGMKNRDYLVHTCCKVNDEMVVKMLYMQNILNLI